MTNNLMTNNLMTNNLMTNNLMTNLETFFCKRHDDRFSSNGSDDSLKGD